MANATTHASEGAHGGESRRDFLIYATVSVAAVGTAVAVWPLIDSMNPSADVLALSSIDVDLSPVAEGQRITVAWRGKPVFIAHRTAAEIDAAQKVNVAELRDPQTDAQRAQKPDWLIVIGICTHLGCVPLGQKSGDPRGEFGGWFCPCHGSQYDTSARIRLGPAPLNLAVPDYKFTGAAAVKIG